MKPVELADNIIEHIKRGFAYAKKKEVKHLASGVYDDKPWEVKVAEIRGDKGYEYHILVVCPVEAAMTLQDRARRHGIDVVSKDAGEYYLITPND